MATVRIRIWVDGVELELGRHIRKILEGEVLKRHRAPRIKEAADDEARIL